MFREKLFMAACNVRNPGFSEGYAQVQEAEFKTFKELRKEQDRRLGVMVEFAYKNVPYYSSLFKNLGIKPGDITSVEDLERLPILTKDTIKKNPEQFFSRSEGAFVEKNTGGSTGEPFRYRVSRVDNSLSAAILYGKWTCTAEYKPGDRVVFVAGASIIPSNRSWLMKMFSQTALNHRFFSSFDMGDQNIESAITRINRYRPQYIYGYASSVRLLCNYILKKNIKLSFQPRAAFTTSEILFKQDRDEIQKAFNCDVFDTYGLNDGGITAWECEKHNGMHVDMVRAVLEVVDEEGKRVGPGGEGRILATSLYNYAMPFIRYDSGDRGIWSEKPCECPRNTPVLEEICGRVFDFVVSPGGERIHGQFFALIFYAMPWVEQFQIVQETPDDVLIKIVDSSGKTDASHMARIENIVKDKMGRVSVEVRIVDSIEPGPGGKRKFIVRRFSL